MQIPNSLSLAKSLAALLLVLAPATAFARQQTEPGEGDKVAFNVWEFRVKGNSLLERTEVERTVYPYLGPDRTIDHVEDARRQLETLYRNSGYPTVLVNIPEQDVSDGIVDLEVIQGRVERLRISDARYFSLGRIREGVPSLAEGQVPYFPKVQEELAALNRASGDRRVTPIFRPGKTPGTVEAELKVKDRFPLHATFGLNDRDTGDTSRLRASASLQYTNLWQREHSASIQVQTAPQNLDDSRVFSGTYVMPAGEAGLLALYGVVSRSDVATAGDISVLGDGTIVGARYIRPFGGSDGVFQSLTLGADYKDFDETVRLDGAGDVDTPIDYFNLMAEYRATVLGETARSVAFVGVDFGVRGLGNTEAEFENKRFQGEPNYVHLGLGVEHTQTFASDIQVFLGLEAQFAGGPLVSNEQFGVGGVDSVRGYFESEHLGDDGVQGRLELISPSVARWMSGPLEELRFFAFADGAKVRVQDPLPGDRSFDELSSLGLGMKLQSLGGLRAGFHWAWPLQETDTVGRGEDRLHFHVEYEM